MVSVIAGLNLEPACKPVPETVRLRVKRFCTLAPKPESSVCVDKRCYSLNHEVNNGSSED